MAHDRRRVGANLSAAANARQTGKNRRCLSGQTRTGRSARAQALPAHASGRSRRRPGGGRTAPCVDAQEGVAPLSSVRGMDGVGTSLSLEARTARALLNSASSWARSRLVSRQWASSARNSAMWSMCDISCSSRHAKTRARTGSCQAGSRSAAATGGAGEWGSRNAPAFWGNRSSLKRADPGRYPGRTEQTPGSGCGARAKDRHRVSGRNATRFGERPQASSRAWPSGQRPDGRALTALAASLTATMPRGALPPSDHRTEAAGCRRRGRRQAESDLPDEPAAVASP